MGGLERIFIEGDEEEMCTREPTPPPIRPPIIAQYYKKYYTPLCHNNYVLTANRNSVTKP